MSSEHVASLASAGGRVDHVIENPVLPKDLLGIREATRADAVVRPQISVHPRDLSSAIVAVCEYLATSAVGLICQRSARMPILLQRPEPSVLTEHGSFPEPAFVVHPPKLGVRDLLGGGLIVHG